MMKMIKKLTAVMLAAALALTGFGCFAPERADAAENKALYVPVSFSGAGWSGNYQKKAVKVESYITMEKEIKLSKSFKMGYTVYIPKPLLKKEGSGFAVDSAIAIYCGGRGDDYYYGDVSSKLGEIRLKKKKSSYKVVYVDKGTKKEKSASKYATAKTSGDYVVLKVKNVPLEDKAYYPIDESKTFAIDTSKKGYISSKITLAGVNTKASSFVYLDNVKISGSQSAKQDFSGGLTGAISQSGDDFGWPSAETFTNRILTLKEDSATIEKGDTVQIEATATPAGEIAYKSSDEAVATVSKKGVVTGVETGTATIKVTANGVTKKFKVTVK